MARLPLCAKDGYPSGAKEAFLARTLGKLGCATGETQMILAASTHAAGGFSVAPDFRESAKSPAGLCFPHTVTTTGYVAQVLVEVIKALRNKNGDVLHRIGAVIDQIETAQKTPFCTLDKFGEEIIWTYLEMYLHAPENCSPEEFKSAWLRRFREAIGKPEYPRSTALREATSLGANFIPPTEALKQKLRDSSLSIPMRVPDCFGQYFFRAKATSEDLM